MADNSYFIDKYKDVDQIIKTYYQVKDQTGKMINVDGIVNPVKIDNRQMCSVPENQGNRPHCAGYSCGNMWEAIYWKRTGRLINLESSQIYALAKQLDGNVDSEGTTLQAAQQACAQLCGVKEPVKLGYMFNDRTMNTIEYLKFLLHKYDFVHIGCNITTEWYRKNKNDYVITPGGTSLGGHAILCCGADQTGAYIQNSWGIEWGAKSFAIIRWDAFLQQFMYGCYIENLYDLKIEQI